MKTELKKVYYCEHCNRHMISKGAMTTHERMCRKNPDNQHQCFKFCKHLGKDVDKETGEILFHCGVIGQDLYSYKLERYHRNSIRIPELTRMPLECDKYECMNGHDFDGHDLADNEYAYVNNMNNFL